jgi:hypothetical protein
VPQWPEVQNPIRITHFGYHVKGPVDNPWFKEKWDCFDVHKDVVAAPHDFANMPSPGQRWPALRELLRGKTRLLFYAGWVLNASVVSGRAGPGWQGGWVLACRRAGPAALPQQPMCQLSGGGRREHRQTATGPNEPPGYCAPAAAAAAAAGQGWAGLASAAGAAEGRLRCLVQGAHHTRPYYSFGLRQELSRQFSNSSDPGIIFTPHLHDKYHEAIRRAARLSPLPAPL